MRNATKILPLLALALAVQPLAADLVVCDMARVVTHTSPLEECLAPVAITRIDGEKQVLSSQGFLIEPGVHTLNGRATLDTTKCQIRKDDLQPGKSPGIEINFKAGRTYYIAYNHAAPHTGDWQLVVWKVDQSWSMFQTCLPANQP